MAIWLGCSALCVLGMPIALALRDSLADGRAGLTEPALATTGG